MPIRNFVIEIGIVIPFLKPNGSASQSPALLFVLNNLVSLSQNRGYLLFVFWGRGDPLIVILILLNGFFNQFECMVFLCSLLMYPLFGEAF